MSYFALTIEYDRTRNSYEIRRRVHLDEIQFKLTGDTIRIDADFHAGFRFVDPVYLVELVRKSSRKFRIQPILIDEREQSGKLFLPTQVEGEAYGNPKVRRVANTKSTYTSQITADIGKVRAAYKSLDQEIYENSVKPILDIVESKKPGKLGEIQKLIFEEIIRNRLEGLGNYEILDSIFEPYDPSKNHTGHRENVHSEADLVYIGLIKDTGFAASKFTDSKRSGLLEGEPIVVIPENPFRYFRR